MIQNDCKEQKLLTEKSKIMFWAIQQWMRFKIKYILWKYPLFQFNFRWFKTGKEENNEKQNTFGTLQQLILENNRIDIKLLKTLLFFILLGLILDWSGKTYLFISNSGDSKLGTKNMVNGKKQTNKKTLQRYRDWYRIHKNTPLFISNSTHMFTLLYYTKG